MEGKKNDFVDKKLRWDLLPLKEIEKIVKVYTAGSEKYGENTWQSLPNGYDRYKAALFRHLLEYEKGHEVDEETGCEHLSQVAWNAIAMMHCAPKWETESFKENLTLCALNKRIEEKIDSTNKILDEMENLVSDKEKERRSKMVEDKRAKKIEIEKEIAELRKKLEYETNSVYKIEDASIFDDESIGLNIIKQGTKPSTGIAINILDRFDIIPVGEIYTTRGFSDIHIADLRFLVDQLIKEYNEHYEGLPRTGDGSVQTEDSEVSE